MNKKATEFNIQGMLIAGLAVGLFITMISALVFSLSGNYDTTGYDDSLEKYNILPNISTLVNEAGSQVEDVTINPSWFDFFAGIWNKIIGPFKFIYRSYRLIFGLTGDVVSDLHLLPFIADFLGAVIMVLVMIGIVMIKYYFGRQK